MQPLHRDRHLDREHHERSHQVAAEDEVKPELGSAKAKETNHDGDDSPDSDHEERKDVPVPVTLAVKPVTKVETAW